MEYIIVCVVAFILGMIYNSGSKDTIDTKVMQYLKQGERVIICVGSNATIFEMIGNKIRITKAETNFIEEPIDLPIGEANANAMDISGSNESGNYNESGVAD